MSKKAEPVDPCDDKMYEKLSLTDFLRHFVPQEESQRKECLEINKKGSVPFADPNFPETMKKEEQQLSRTERRQKMLKERKANKKKK